MSRIATTARRAAVVSAVALAGLPAVASADMLAPNRSMPIPGRLATSVGRATVSWQRSFLHGVTGVSVSGGYGGNMTGSPFMDRACASTRFTVYGRKVSYSTTVGLPLGLSVTSTPSDTAETVTFQPMCRAGFNNIWINYSGLRFTGQNLSRITQTITYTGQKAATNTNAVVVATESDLP
jgi:hypothetical protein